MSKNEKVIHTSYSQLQEGYTYEKSNRPGVLATLHGKFSESDNPTRNGNEYTDELLSSIVEDPKVKEQIENKTLFGELSHPAKETEYLTEVQMPNVSHNITDLSYDPTSHVLEGTLDILDTPNGRIANTFLQYGSKLGISSRGVSIDDDYDARSGKMTPNNYYYITHDLVALPGVKGARLDQVTESINPLNMKSVSGSSAWQLKDMTKKALESKDIESLKVFKSCLESTSLRGKYKLLSSIESILETVNSPVESPIDDPTESPDLSPIEDPTKGVEEKPNINITDNDEEDVTSEGNSIDDDKVESTTETSSDIPITAENVSSDESHIDKSLDNIERDASNLTKIESTEVNDISGGMVNGIFIKPDNLENYKKVLSTLEELDPISNEDGSVTVSVTDDQLSDLVKILTTPKDEDTPDNLNIVVDPDAPEVIDTDTKDDVLDTLESIKESMNSMISENKELVKILRSKVESVTTELTKEKGKNLLLKKALESSKDNYIRLETSKNKSLKELSTKVTRLESLKRKSVTESANLKSAMSNSRTKVSQLESKYTKLLESHNSLQKKYDIETNSKFDEVSETKRKLESLVSNKGKFSLKSLESGVPNTGSLLSKESAEKSEEELNALLKARIK